MMRAIIAIAAVLMFIAGFVTYNREERLEAPSNLPIGPKKPNPPSLIPFPGVDIVSWEKSGFDNVAIVTVKITNWSKDAWISDVVLSCSFRGNSGSVINSRNVTVFETIQPLQSLVAKKLNVGFIDQQVKNASCRALTAKMPTGREML